MADNYLNLKKDSIHKCAICGKEISLGNTFFYHCHENSRLHTETLQWGFLPNQKMVRFVESYDRVDVGICKDCRKQMKEGQKIANRIKYAIFFVGTSVLAFIILALFNNPDTPFSWSLSGYGLTLFFVYMFTWFIFVRLGRYIGKRYAKSKGFFLDTTVEDGKKSNSLLYSMLFESAPEKSLEGLIACSLAIKYPLPPYIYYLIEEDEEEEKTRILYNQIVNIDFSMESFRKKFGDLKRTAAAFYNLDDDQTELFIDDDQDKYLGLNPKKKKSRKK